MADTRPAGPPHGAGGDLRAQRRELLAKAAFVEATLTAYTVARNERAPEVPPRA